MKVDTGTAVIIIGAMIAMGLWALWLALDVIFS